MDDIIIGSGLDDGDEGRSSSSDVIMIDVGDDEPDARPTIFLLVIKVRDIETSKTFYNLIGLEFADEKHGTGPRHYASVVDGFVFEIYPNSDGLPASPQRFGFRVRDMDDILAKLRRYGARVVGEAKKSPWGRRAVVEDADGNHVELLAALG